MFVFKKNGQYYTIYIQFAIFFGIPSTCSKFRLAKYCGLSRYVENCQYFDFQSGNHLSIG